MSNNKNTKSQRTQKQSSGVRVARKAKITEEIAAREAANIAAGRGRHFKSRSGITEVNGHKCRYADHNHGKFIDVAAIFAPRQHPDALCLITEDVDFKPEDGIIYPHLGEVVLKG